MKKQESENYDNNPKSHESLLLGSLLTQHFQITVFKCKYFLILEFCYILYIFSSKQDWFWIQSLDLVWLVKAVDDCLFFLHTNYKT